MKKEFAVQSIKIGKSKVMVKVATDSQTGTIQLENRGAVKTSPPKEGETIEVTLSEETLSLLRKGKTVKITPWCYHGVLTGAGTAESAPQPRDNDFKG
jgi:hypothetical protein